ncbi:MAG: hypothetical protein GX163_11300 [Bacteroidetes bacterium]|jgi:hypothetical protein|nr:hypothetical protein [Bacteroidota bacterium]
MRIIYKLVVFIIIFSSCENIEKEYYKNGNIKAKYQTQNGVLHGDYFQYDSLGILTSHHIYNLGKRIDSSIYYKDGNIWYINYFVNGKIHLHKQYYPNGKIKEYGSIVKENLRIGKWRFYNERGYLEEIKEFKLVDGESYLNQNWFFDVNGDTLKNQGSYYDLWLVSDTITLKDPVVGVVDLINPVIKDRKTYIKVVVPKDYSPDFNEDFSNVNTIDIDTTYNLNIEKDYREQAGLEGNFERTAIFGRYYETSGLKTFRGIIIEYAYDVNDRDTLGLFEHRKYFEKEVFVKDSI